MHPYTVLMPISTDHLFELGIYHGHADFGRRLLMALSVPMLEIPSLRGLLPRQRPAHRSLIRDTVFIGRTGLCFRPMGVAGRQRTPWKWAPG